MDEAEEIAYARLTKNDVEFEAWSAWKQEKKAAAEWFDSLKVGDTVYNYSVHRPENRMYRKLRTGIILELHPEGKYGRYLIVDNLTTKRKNKWGEWELVMPDYIEDMRKEVARLDEIVKASRPPTSASMFSSEVDAMPTMERQRFAKEEFLRLLKRGKELSTNSGANNGKCAGVYGAFNKKTGECIYIGKSGTDISRRWREHSRVWKKDRPIHRQPLLTQYLYFFGNQIAWRVLLPMDKDVDVNMVEYCERRMFEKFKPIANGIVPNGTYFGRSMLEGEGEMVSVSDGNPNMVQIRIHKGEFNGFSDGVMHFEKPDYRQA